MVSKKIRYGVFDCRIDGYHIFKLFNNTKRCICLYAKYHERPNPSIDILKRNNEINGNYDEDTFNMTYTHSWDEITLLIHNYGKFHNTLEDLLTEEFLNII